MTQKYLEIANKLLGRAPKEVKDTYEKVQGSDIETYLRTAITNKSKVGEIEKNQISNITAFIAIHQQIQDACYEISENDTSHSWKELWMKYWWPSRWIQNETKYYSDSLSYLMFPNIQNDMRHVAFESQDEAKQFLMTALPIEEVKQITRKAYTNERRLHRYLNLKCNITAIETLIAILKIEIFECSYEQLKKNEQSEDWLQIFRHCDQAFKGKILFYTK